MEGVVNCMMDSVTDLSPRQLARIAGGLYLINIVGGAFAIGFVRAALFTPDVATTAHNIQTHQLLYRLGLAAHLVVTVTNVPLALHPGRDRNRGRWPRPRVRTAGPSRQRALCQRPAAGTARGAGIPARRSVGWQLPRVHRVLRP